MILLLEDTATGLSVQVEPAETLREMLAIQFGRLEDSAARESFSLRIAKLLEQGLADVVDWDLKAPTAAQVSFATAICRELGVALPGEALRYRGTMHEFLDKYAPAMKERTEGKANSAPSRNRRE
jgi:hypothetical protein